jgi:hypothetical protein
VATVIRPSIAPAAEREQSRRFRIAARLLGDLLPGTPVVDLDLTAGANDPLAVGPSASICADGNRDYAYKEVEFGSLDRFLLLTRFECYDEPAWVAVTAPSIYLLTEALRASMANSEPGKAEPSRIVLDLDKCDELKFTVRVRVEIEWDGLGTR